MPWAPHAPGTELLGDISHGDAHNARAGHAADPWNLVWVNGYRLIEDPATGLPAALLRPEQILRIRPLTQTR